MSRRLGLLFGALGAAALLSSCGAMSDRVATVNGKDISYDAFKAYALQKAGGKELPKSGEETRRALTQMIKEAIPANPVPADEAGKVYETGFNGSPLVCLGAIALAEPATADEVKSALHAGTALADLAQQYGSEEQAGAPNGVLSLAGDECYSPEGLDTGLRASLSAVPVGDGVDFNSGGASLIVLLRPWDALKPESQQQIATALGTTASLSTAKVSINAKYGRWDAASGTVVADG